MRIGNLFASTAFYLLGGLLVAGFAGCAHGEGAMAGTQASSQAPAGDSAAQNAAITNRDAPVNTSVGQLTPDSQRTVRVVGLVSRSGQMRMVPPRTVFRLRDDSGAVTVVLHERKVLSEGTRVEIVGRYKDIPSPAHVDVDDAPLEACLVVERYLILP